MHLLRPIVGVMALGVSVLCVASEVRAQSAIDAQVRKLRGSGPPILVHDMEFGSAVDVSGVWAVVGAPHYDANSFPARTGAVYVFEDTSTTWVERARLEPSYMTDEAEFGANLAISGETIVVGVPTQERAYVFIRCGDTWVEQATLVHPPPYASEGFGQAVDVEGDTIAVGSRTTICSNYSGSVCVFVRDDGGTPLDPCDDLWVLETPVPLQTSVCGSHSDFGWALSLDGDRLLVGAPNHIYGGDREGSAFVFDRIGGTWAESARLLAPNGQDADRFGAAVALHGDRALVGAPFDDAPELDRGSVRVFEYAAGSWSLALTLTAPDGAADEWFGTAVALQGSVALASSPTNDYNGYWTGLAYLFHLSSGAVLGEQVVSLADGEAHDFFGSSVALDGSTMFVGAPLADDADVGGRVGVFTVSVGEFDRFGFGDGTSGVDCPCGNASLVGAEQGCENSTGRGGKLSVSGSDSASADDFQLVGWNLIPDRSALLFGGENLANGGAGVPFGNGLRLVNGAIARFGISIPSASGRALWGPGIGGAADWPVGTAVHFQAWYRDPSHNGCVDAFNLTNGVTIRFRP